MSDFGLLYDCFRSVGCSTESRASYEKAVKAAGASLPANVLEGHEKLLNSTAPAQVKVISAKYGVSNSSTDVTPVVRKMFLQTKVISSNGQKYRFQDLAPGQPKFMKLELSINGGIISLLLPENSELRL